jgi:guanylate kinase
MALATKTAVQKTDEVRHAETDGLRVVFVSRSKFIRGAAWLEFLEAKEKERNGSGRLRQQRDED